MNRILKGDCLSILETLPDGFARLAYIDPPFNTGRTQKRARIRAVTSKNGARIGFGGRRFDCMTLDSASFEDAFDDYLGFLMPRIAASLRCLTDDGSLFVHIDSREVHYVKVALDRLLGRDCFMNEIIWVYDFGGRSTKKWSNKHDTILWYVQNPREYVFNFDAIDRIPYLAPGLVGPSKAKRGKTPTDAWWNTVVPTNGSEKTGYPTQKPLAILNRIVRVHSEPGDTVLDFFAGSGTTGYAAAMNSRRYVLIDNSEDAIRTMKSRLHSTPQSQHPGVHPCRRG